MERLGILLAMGMLLSPASVVCAAEEKAYEVQTVKDVEYYTGPDQHKTKHKLDLYLPKGLKDFPVLFFVHGGAWTQGDKDYFGAYALFASAYVKKGIGVVVTNYRLSPGVKHPEHVKDVARAFAWVHNNIAKHGGRPDRLFTCGHSAGAHLVSLLAGDESYLKAHELTAKAIRGVIPISGPYVLRDGFMPRVFGDDKANGKKISPISHVRQDMPPFLIFYADKDMAGCDKKPAEAFCNALKSKENRAETVEIVDSDHIRIIVSAGTETHKMFGQIVGFIRTTAGK